MQSCKTLHCASFMAISSNCCLNLMPQLPDSSSIPTPKPSLFRAEESERTPQRRSPKLVTGLTCAIIGLEMVAFVPISMPVEVSDRSDGSVSALTSGLVQPVSNQGGKWSDKRKCMPWNLNSFETIVPENLPRPSAHRRWESVAYDSHGHRLAPPVKTITVIKTRAGCFTM